MGYQFYSPSKATCPILLGRGVNYRPMVSEISVLWDTREEDRLPDRPNAAVIGLSVAYETWHHPVRVGVIIDWDCLVPHCIMGSLDQWEFPPFFRPQWQSLYTALGLCKGTLKYSMRKKTSSLLDCFNGPHVAAIAPSRAPSGASRDYGTVHPITGPSWGWTEGSRKGQSRDRCFHVMTLSCP